MLRRRSVRAARRGAAAVELAVLLPLLAFLFVAGIDFARVFYHCVILTNCARNGALYGSLDANHAADAAGIRTSVLRDATNLSPDPDVTSRTGTDAEGHPFVEVTVTWRFETVTMLNIPGVPGSMTLTRTVQMRVAPTVPKNS